MFNNCTIAINNVLARLRGAQAPGAGVLLLLPHCMQSSECSQQVTADISNCQRCGKCPLAQVFALADKYGCQCYVAKGGREAVQRVRRSDVRVVVAVACEKELSAGIFAAFPKPIIAVPNQQPCGYCNNTIVDPAAVEAVLQRVVTDAPA